MTTDLEAVVKVASPHRCSGAADKVREILSRPEFRDVMAEMVEREPDIRLTVWILPQRKSQAGGKA